MFNAPYVQILFNRKGINTVQINNSYQLSFKVFFAIIMGKNLDLSDVDKGQIVMSRRLEHAFLNSETGWLFVC